MLLLFLILIWFLFFANFTHSFMVREHVMLLLHTNNLKGENLMKKICVVILVCIVLLSITGCGKHILTTKCKTSAPVYSEELGNGTYTKIITTDDFTGETVSIEEVYEWDSVG